MKLTTFLGGLGAGFILGAVAGVIYTSKTTSKRVMELANDIADEEVKMFVDEYLKRAAENNKEADTSEVVEEYDDETETEDLEDSAPYASYNSLGTMIKPPPQELFKDIEDEHPQEPDEEEDILEENPVKYDREEQAPKLISQDSFDTDADDFEKDTLYYYQEDDVLADPDDEEVNEYEYVGECLDKFGFRNNEESEIHVRNFEKQVDYEVIKMFTSYR